MDRNYPDTAAPPAHWVFDLQVLEVAAFLVGVLMVFWY
jgi:hypothetical protein